MYSLQILTGWVLQDSEHMDFAQVVTFCGAQLSLQQKWTLVTNSMVEIFTIVTIDICSGSHLIVFKEQNEFMNMTIVTPQKNYHNTIYIYCDSK